MTTPRISIITPSYNQATFLGRTLGSVAGQNYQNLEHIVVDGGSTDGSTEVLAAWRDRLTCCISERDDGQADAMNKGFRRATGDILAWLNSDDIYCPGALRAVADYFVRNPEVDVVMGDLEIIDADDRRLGIKKVVPFSFRQNLYSGCAVPQPATFFTRRAYEITGELDASLRYQMDYEFFLRMQARGVRFGVVHRPLARFRLHQNSKTVADYDEVFWRDFARIQEPYTSPMVLALGAGGRRMLKWLTRLELFTVRAMKRGVLIPFRHSRLRRKHHAMD